MQRSKQRQAIFCVGRLSARVWIGIISLFGQSELVLIFQNSEYYWTVQGKEKTDRAYSY